VFLLVLAHPGSPGQRAVKRLLLLLILCLLLWPSYGIGQAIIFLPCGFFLLSSVFFSSPNLSSHSLDVYHTSSHCVALVQILNAGLKSAARGSQEILDAKNRHFGTIAQLCRVISLELRHASIIGKKFVKQQYLLHMSW